MKKNSFPVVRSVIVKGALHDKKNLPCQDYCKHNINGKNFVAVVSDGAGSAKFGKIGAKIICDTIVDLLSNTDIKNTKKRVKEAIKIARDKTILHRFNKSKSDKHMNDFAATIIGLVYHKNKGLFFHIGDGAALAFNDLDRSNVVISRPENGLFACETFFYTMEDWERSLRFTEIEDVNTFFLMTDGLTNFAFSSDFEQINTSFILPINDFLNKEKIKYKALRALGNTINTPKAHKLNSDDKTLLWAKI